METVSRDGEREREITRQIGSRAYAIWKQPWRLIRNHRLRAEIDALMETAGQPPGTQKPPRAGQDAGRG